LIWRFHQTGEFSLNLCVHTWFKCNHIHLDTPSPNFEVRKLYNRFIANQEVQIYKINTCLIMCIDPIYTNVGDKVFLPSDYGIYRVTNDLNTDYQTCNCFMPIHKSILPKHAIHYGALIGTRSLYSLYATLNLLYEPRCWCNSVSVSLFRKTLSLIGNIYT
jgi:hypothetical protein